MEGDDPMTEHSTLFPMCPFVLGYQVGNIPLGDEDQVSESPGHDEAGLRPPDWSQDHHREPNSGAEKLLASSESLGVLKHSGPLHPQYATLEARLRTFREWPPALKQQPKDLADAGFYYIGLSDQVKCFYCDGGLRNWQSEDEPWQEHARWFEKCVFVRLVKGDDYIRQCVEERPPEKANLNLQSGPRTVTEEEYDELVSRPNLNREADVVAAKSVDEAISGLQSIGLAEQAPVDPHPERRLRAAYKAFEEEQLPIMKREMPGLTLKQYKDKLWKQFKKSPANPVVAARLQQQQQ